MQQTGKINGHSAVTDDKWWYLCKLIYLISSGVSFCKEQDWLPRYPPKSISCICKGLCKSSQNHGIIYSNLQVLWGQC